MSRSYCHLKIQNFYQKNIYILLAFVFGFCLGLSSIRAEESTATPPAQASEKEPAQEARAQGQTQAQAQTQPPKFDLNQYVLFLEPSLNFSLGIEKTADKVYLIIEMDHNPSRNEFTLRLDSFLPERRFISVGLENLPFGFNNSPVVKLPLVELQKPEQSSAKWLMDSSVYRTHQRINITRLLDEMSKEGKLMDENGRLYRTSELHHLMLIVSKEFAQGGEARVLDEIRIPLNNLESDRILQVFGEEVLSEIKDQSRYKVGDRVSLRDNFKLPHRPDDTQWVRLPNSKTEEATFKLIKNPRANSTYNIPKGTAQMERVLPKIPNDMTWVKVSETSRSETYELRSLPTKMSPNIMVRYAQNAFLLLAGLIEKNVDVTPERIAEALSTIPIELSEAERAKAAEEVLRRGLSPTEIFTIMQEAQEALILARRTGGGAFAGCRAYLQ